MFTLIPTDKFWIRREGDMKVWNLQCTDCGWEREEIADYIGGLAHAHWLSVHKDVQRENKLQEGQISKVVPS